MTADEYADKVSVGERILSSIFIGQQEFNSVSSAIRAAFVAGQQSNTEEHPLATLAARVHTANAKWWVDINTGKPIKRNVGELLMLAVSELAEALEGHRKGLQDDKLLHRQMFEVEIADCVIRLLDIAGGLKLDLGGAFEEKMAYNAVRADHQLEARRAADGKKY